jgi:hypothetical protein
MALLQSKKSDIHTRSTRFSSINFQCPSSLQQVYREWKDFGDKNNEIEQSKKR